MLKWAREEYEDQLEDLKHQPGVTEEDVRNYEQSVLIKRSVEEV